MTKKWLLVALDKWPCYTVATVWKWTWADSGFVVLEEWLCYRGGPLSRFDCTNNNNTLENQGIVTFFGRIPMQSAKRDTD